MLALTRSRRRTRASAAAPGAGALPGTGRSEGCEAGVRELDREKRQRTGAATGRSAVDGLMHKWLRYNKLGQVFLKSRDPLGGGLMEETAVACSR